MNRLPVAPGAALCRQRNSYQRAPTLGSGIRRNRRTTRARAVTGPKTFGRHLYTRVRAPLFRFLFTRQVVAVATTSRCSRRLNISFCLIRGRYPPLHPLSYRYRPFAVFTTAVRSSSNSEKSIIGPYEFRFATIRLLPPTHPQNRSLRGLRTNAIRS